MKYICPTPHERQKLQIAQERQEAWLYKLSIGVLATYFSVEIFRGIIILLIK